MKLTAESTVINDSKLNTDIDNAQDIATQAKTVADNTAQYFWFTSSGTDTGAHISEKTQAQFEASPSGGNLLARSNGVAVRDGLTELAQFGSNGVSFKDDSNNELGALEVYSTATQRGSTLQLAGDVNLVSYVTSGTGFSTLKINSGDRIEITTGTFELNGTAYADVYSTTASEIFSNIESGVSISAVEFSRLGVTCQIRIEGTVTTAKSGTWSIGTLYPAFRPSIECGAFVGNTTDRAFIYGTGSVMYVGTRNANASFYVLATYLTTAI